MDDNAFLVPVHGAPPKEEQIAEVIVHNASASDLDEDTLSELGAYEDKEVEDPLGRAIQDDDYDLDREYYATEEESDEDEDSDIAQTRSEEGYCIEPGRGKGRRHQTSPNLLTGIPLWANNLGILTPVFLHLYLLLI